jgi:SAM-dependent methyltransferase
VEHFTPQEIRQILREAGRVLTPDGRIVIFWPHHYGTSVNVLRVVHWISNSLLKRPMQLHPPEITHCQSRSWAEAIVRESGLVLDEYSFGPGDFWVQAVLILKKQ